MTSAFRRGSDTAHAGKQAARRTPRKSRAGCARWEVVPLVGRHPERISSATVPTEMSAQTSPSDSVAPRNAGDRPNGDRPLVSVLVVGYRSLRYLDASIGGAWRSLGPVAGEVLFVDCSEDGSAAFVRERHPRTTVVEGAGNLGFAGGNNLLAREARGEYLLLLNPDTAPKRDEIARLVAFAERVPDAGIWGGRTVLPDGSPDHGSHQRALSPSGLLVSALGLHRVLPGKLPYPARGGVHRVAVVSGAFLLIRRSLWERLGGFDRDYFMYAEEVDLCRRARDLGAAPVCDASIELVHDAGSGESERPERRANLLRGNATYLRRHHGPIAAWIGLATMLLHEWLRLLAARTVLAAVRPARARTLASRARMAIALRPQWWMGWPAATERR